MPFRGVIRDGSEAEVRRIRGDRGAERSEALSAFRDQSDGRMQTA